MKKLLLVPVVLLAAAFILLTSCSADNNGGGRAIRSRLPSDNTSYDSVDHVLDVARKLSPDCRGFKATDNDTAP
jgi:hypothetical protein